MERPTAFIFDLDGVLADTVEVHYYAWKQIAEQLDLPFSRADMDTFRGRRRRDCLLTLLDERQIPESELEALLELKDQLYQARLDMLDPAEIVLPGVFDFVHAASARGLRLGVASSSANARLLLEKTGLMAFMQAVADGFTVKRSKPAPDIFIWVAGALQVRPTEVVIFEDSKVGVVAGQTAGMYVVGLGAEAALAEPDLAVTDIQALQVDDLLARLG